MKAKLLAAALLLAATPAHATIYTYEGGLIVHPIGTDRIRGTVEFDFDTSAFTGGLWLQDTTSLSLSFGAYTMAHFLGGPGAVNFILAAGSIVDWYAYSTVPCGGNSLCFVTTGQDDGMGGGPFDEIAHQCGFQCSPWSTNPLAPPALGRSRGSIGSWTMATPAQVPGPIVGAGLPGLMMLLALWRRRRCARSC